MKSLKIFSIALLAAATLLTAGCKKKEILEFGGQMDQFSATDENGQKTYFGHAEQWIYWEEGDDIKAYCNGESSVCDLVSGSGTLTAFFRSQNPLSSDYPVYAIYPASSGADGGYSTLTFPATQPYRQAGTPTDPDSSFGIGALPMVAYEAAGTDATIYFHVVAGILRVQLFSSDVRTIQSIQFKEVGGAHSSTNKQISGVFTLNDIDQNQPYLTATTNTPSDAARTITITNINKQIGPNPDQFLTFYLPLPATGNPYGGADNKEHYILEMTVNDNTGYKCVKTLGADIRRRNITMMRALKCTSWTESGTGSGSEINLVGNGTKDRPFQIYTAEELRLVRDSFNVVTNRVNKTVRINGQIISGVPSSGETDNATHFKIVRSDIKLVTQQAYNAMSAEERKKAVVWNEGIKNFKGYMYFASSTATNGGITNESNVPLFESIEAGGKLQRVYVKGNSTPNVSAAFSPMCNTNYGEMLECHNKCNVTLSVDRPLAGLCVNNHGRIIGGANEAQLTSTNGNVAGICYTNNGTIQGNFTLSAAVPQGNNIAGIAYNNNATVKDCQVSSNTSITSTGNWGVIAFNNNAGAVIDNCTSTGAVIYTIDGSVGGICNVNNGIVKNCTNGVEIRASSGNVGGIVATMNSAAAEVYNSCTRAPFLNGALDISRVADNIGGIVGYFGAGKVYNCYNTSFVSGATNSGGVIGFMSIDAAADVQNCWSAQGQSFIGMYENREAHHVGPFCFSANVAAVYCNRVANTTITVGSTEFHQYQIVTMHPDQTLGGTVDPSEFEGKHLGKALNAWVSNHSADGRDYYTWRVPTQTEEEEGIIVRPVFNTGMPGGGKKGRSRR